MVYGLRYPLCDMCDTTVSRCQPKPNNLPLSPTRFNRQAVQYIRNVAKEDKPFFMYFSTTTPHTGDLSGDPSSCTADRNDLQKGQETHPTLSCPP